uniref:Calponin-homology (CH) domain-containing protein n=1 Tax=Caenorhabditis japonica TaxID=281687 RepID=A0A8R1DIQ7_CAEJA
MKLMFLIETAHSQKIISNLTRIFTKSSCFKCLDDMASDLTKEMLSGSSASLKKAFAKIGFTPSYKQSFVENYDYEAKGFEDFSDGLILAKLIETIGEMEHGQLLLKLRDPAGDRIRKINNVKTVFAAMNEMGISTENATPACVVGGKKEAILSILWALIGVRVAKEKKIRIPRTVDKTPKLYDVVCQVLSNRQSIGSSERSLSPCSTIQNGTFTISQFSDRQSIDITLNDATFTVSRESVDSVGGFKMPKTPTRVTFSRTTISNTIDQVIEEEEEDEDGESTIVPSTARKRNVVSVEHKVFETFEESSELEEKEEEKEEEQRDENQDPDIQGISHQAVVGILLLIRKWATVV